MTVTAAQPSEARFGRGQVTTAFVAGSSAVTTLASRSPLKLVVSRERARCVRVHSANFGGGLLAGDAVDIDVDVGTGSTLAFGTSAPGKVYRSEGAVSSQTIRARVAADATLALVPEPIAAYAGARYLQRTDIDLDATASLLLTDVVAAGRTTRNERWAFDSLDVRTRLRIDGRLVLHEALRLGALDPERFSGVDALSFALLAGPRFASLIDRLHTEVNATSPSGPVRLAASRWPWGIVLRGAASDVESLVEAQRRLLEGAFIELDEAAWHPPW